MSVVAVLSLLLLAPVHAEDIHSQAERLATLRAEVEALSSALELEKDDLRGQMRAVEAQQIDLEVQIRREELRLERLLAEEEAQRQLLEARAGQVELAPVVLAGIARARADVQASLPFKTAERLGALDELEAELTAGRRSAEQTTARLWSFLEDERRLTRETALSRQVISLDGAEVLVDVARLGMVALYLRTPDGAHGQALPSRDGGGTWTWVVFPEGSSADQQVRALFDALSRGIRVGSFTLPQPLVGVR